MKLQMKFIVEINLKAKFAGKKKQDMVIEAKIRGQIL